MSRENIKTALLFMLAGLGSGLFVGLGLGGVGGKFNTPTKHVTITDTILHVDTIAYYVPVAKDSTVVKYVTIKAAAPLCRVDSVVCNEVASVAQVSDSVAVEIPITQKRYDGEDYRAYVSGYLPSLDSIFVYAQSKEVRIREYKPPNRWGVGVTIGYGYARQGFSPYIGVGISYQLITF